MRRFHLYRLEDESGKSGKGIVAEGIVFTDGSVVIRWMSTTPTTTLFNARADMEKIHGHDGKTQIIWKDE